MRGQEAVVVLGTEAFAVVNVATELLFLPPVFFIIQNVEVDFIVLLLTITLLAFPTVL